MIDTFSTGVLLLLGIVAFENYAKGTLGSWFKSKFFNQTATSGSSGSSSWLGDLLNPAKWAAGAAAAGEVPGSSSSSSSGGGTSTGAKSAGTDVGAFITQLLAAIGAPASPSNLAFLRNWIAREGTKASNNPLATTLHTSDSVNQINSVGVQEYSTLNGGVAATLQTLEWGYPHIVADLKRGDGTAAGNEATELSKWSGGGYNHISAAA